MNKTFFRLLFALLAGAIVLPASAGPDWTTIEQARKAKREARSQPRQEPTTAVGSSGTGLKCPPTRPTLLLDHGPRADTSPYRNRLRQERYEAQVKACRDSGL